jgi:DNA-binding Lrp family transcriptional regulator
MSTHRFPSFDPDDIRLMTELESDATQTYKDLADKLGISRPTVATKVRKLLDSGVIKIICWADPVALGYKISAGLTIYAKPGRIIEAAHCLAAFTQVSHVQLVTGRFNIMAWIQFKEREELSNFLTNEFSSIPGVIYVETNLMLKQIKVSPRLLIDKKESPLLENVTKDLDELDFKLIRELQTNARQKADHLAKTLGVSDTTVLRRIQRLVDEQVIRIRTLVHPFALGYEGVATLGLKCDIDRVKKAAEAVASYRNVQYVSISTGRYDVSAFVVFQNLSDLWNFITLELGSIPGLRDVDTIISHKIIKTSFPYSLS